MKKDKINIDEFFKEYVDSLPDSNFTDEMNQRLKNSIFEKITENRTQRVESNFTRISKFVIRKKYVFTSLAAASILLVFSILFIINNKSKNEVKNNVALGISNSNINKSKLDTIQAKPKVEDTKYEEIQLAILNYDITSRGSNNDENYNYDEEVLNFIIEELNSNNLKYELINNVINTDQFLYKEKYQSLKITINRNSKNITFNLLSKSPQGNEFEKLKVNPQNIKKQIEKKILSLVEIE